MNPGASTSVAELASDKGPAAGTRSGFWASYWKSLKPREVEEPIDVWVHRPLAYLIARALLPTKISPNTVTFVSILFGLCAGALLVLRLETSMLIAGVCIFLSAVFDCADGQLARLRGTSSAFGRMLDGIADLVVCTAAVGGAVWTVWCKYQDAGWLGWAALGLAVVTVITGSFHTSMYDHYKNVFLRFTSAAYREGEDYETALARYQARSTDESIWARLSWPVYVFYVKSQLDYVRGFDPFTSARLNAFPAFDAARAVIYRKHAAGPMRVWRTLFGFGSLVFGLAVATTFDMIEVYLLLRLVGLNAVFFGYLRPRQREASRRAFAELGLVHLTPAGEREPEELEPAPSAI